ncbi:MAG: ribbon-helix-helix protein, CopG family [Alicyclobacillus sp.]|nr:ribbon-helix-helix protein, CopG family [Alicyclobacillus sp.]
MATQTDTRVQIRVRMDSDALALLDAESERRKISRDQLIREAVDTHLSVDVLHRYTPLLRDAFDGILQRHVDRLSKLSAKGARSAEATFYLVTEMMQMLDGINVEDATYEARKKAAAYVRSPLTDEIGEYDADN